MGNPSTRREFLKQSAAFAAVAAVAPTIAEAAAGKSRLVIVRDSKVLANGVSPGGVVNEQVLSAMLDDSMRKLTGKPDAKTAWRSLFKPDDVVGIKVNGLYGKGASTHPEVAYAVAVELGRAGVKKENIIIWDRSTGDLLKSGFKINKGPGVQVLANDGEWEEEATKLGSFNGRLTKIVTQKITAMINIPIMKDHSLSGISGALKNHYGTFHNPGDHHGGNCNPFLADLNAIPAIKDKTRLVIMDALRPMANGGPGLSKDFQWDYCGLILSQDPVAVDQTAWTLIEEQRKKIGLNTLEESKRKPIWIATAARMRLGVNDPSKMEVIKIG